MSLLFFKLAIRNILRNKLHSVINTAGLSIGFATSLYVFLFTRAETGYDSFYPGSERIFRIIETTNSVNGNSVSAFTCHPWAPEFASSVPGIDDFCRVTDQSAIRCFIDDQLVKVEGFRFADDNFFSFFHLPLLSGDPDVVLDSPDKIVLSQTEAKRLFNGTDPLGKMIIYNQKPFTVSGVSADLPSNTHLRFSAIASIHYIEQNREDYYLGWDGGMRFLSYVSLSPSVTHGTVEKGITPVLNEKINKRIERTGTSYSSYLQNIREVHISDGKINFDCSGTRSSIEIIIVSTIGIFILLLAIANYISLYVTQKNEKIREMGILSVFGAGMKQLVFQEYLEVIIVSLISAFLGIWMFMLITPFLNDLLETSVSLSQNLITTLIFSILMIAVISAIIVCLSSLRLFNVRISEIIKGRTPVTGRKNLPGRIMVTFQFTVVLILVASVLFVNRQGKLITGMDTGFAKNDIITLQSDKEFRNRELDGFRQDLLTLPGVSVVSLTSQPLGQGLTMNGYRITGENAVAMMNVIYTDSNFLNCFDISLVSGRNFHGSPDNDLNSILVNLKLVKRAGWSDPINQTIERDGKLVVIGTVKDFNFAPLYSEIAPMLIMCNPAHDGWGFSCINIRFNTGDVAGLLKRINDMWENRFPGVTYETAFLDEQLRKNYESLYAGRRILSIFSLISIMIACMGLFGLTSFIAGTRSREIGIRKINGASSASVIMMLNISFLKFYAWAFVIACPLIFIIMNGWLQNFAYRITAGWVTCLFAAIAVFLAAVLTVVWQSYRAAIQNPARILRYE